ncbi:hypothetical protein [Porphyromonas sp.]|uniref:hypothetical protein n=1 Tax=Porphyromonas sp. TaxID=1924944 RepID=UPI0026DCE8FC|nr:hypothetical protein [Porphyromonas sp.]MDO4770743.1 hypothetical protein [Porphyromonas sp.]
MKAKFHTVISTFLCVGMLVLTSCKGNNNPPVDPGNKNEKTEDKENEEESEGSSTVADPTESEVFVKWYKSLKESTATDANSFVLSGNNVFKTLGVTVPSNENTLLLKKDLRKPTLDIEKLLSDPDFEDRIQRMRVLSSEMDSHQTEVMVGEHKIGLVTYEASYLKDRISLLPFSAYPLLKEFEEDLYSSALGTSMQGYGPYLIDNFYRGFMTDYCRCIIPKALQDDKDPGVKKALGKLYAALDKANMKKYLNKNGDLLYYHLNLIGGTGSVNPASVFDPETETLKMKEFVEKIESTGEYAVLLPKRHLSEISEILMEKNFKDHLVPENFANAPKEETKPFIEIVRIKVSPDKDFYDVGACLYTRNGDRILLTERLDPIDPFARRVLGEYKTEEGFRKAAEALKQTLSKVFTIEIKINATDKLNVPSEETFFYEFRLLDKDRKIMTIHKAFAPDLRRYAIYTKHSSTDVLIFYASKEDKASKVSHMINLYGMEKLVEKLEEKEIGPSDSFSKSFELYNVIGL